MDDLYIVLVVIGGLVVVLGLLSNPIKERSYLSVPLLALLTGIVLGPHVFGVLDVSAWGQEERILEEASRLTLAIGLMAIALRLPPAYIKQEWRTLLVLIVVVMPLMWLISSVLAYALLGIPLLVALLIGGAVTPTDPIVASSIVTGPAAHRYLPSRVRHVLSGEAGLNDGLALLLVLLPVLLLTREAGEALSHWIMTGFLHEVLGGTAVGLIVGYAAGLAFTWGERRHWMEQSSFLAYTTALALLTLGLARLAGTDGILAVFIAGLCFDDVVGGRERAAEARVQEAVNQFFTLPIFALVGLSLPLDRWGMFGWRGLLLAVAILLFRRLPLFVTMKRWMPSLPHRRDILFTGWFGPIGVSAVLYALLASSRTGNEDVWTVVSLVICASIAAHGITALPFMKWYRSVAPASDYDEEGEGEVEDDVISRAT